MSGTLIRHLCQKAAWHPATWAIKAIKHWIHFVCIKTPAKFGIILVSEFDQLGPITLGKSRRAKWLNDLIPKQGCGALNLKLDARPAEVTSAENPGIFWPGKSIVICFTYHCATSEGMNEAPPFTLYVVFLCMEDAHSWAPDRKGKVQTSPSENAKDQSFTPKLQLKFMKLMSSPETVLDS